MQADLSIVRAVGYLRTPSGAENHYFGGLDQGGGGLALFQAHFANSIGGND